MRRLILSLALVGSGSSAFAKGGSYFGLNVGGGFPYLTQGGINYVASQKLSFELNYGLFSLSLTSLTAKTELKLSQPSLITKWHAMGGSFWVGVGVGQQTLSSTATDSLTPTSTAKIEVSSLTVTPALGWMWGISDGGLFGGLDFGMQVPMSPKTTITSALPETDPVYIDAKEQGDKYGKTSFPVFAGRIGFLF